MAGDFVTYQYKKTRSSPTLRWADSGPLEYPERMGTRYYNRHDPVRYASDSDLSTPPITTVKKILKRRTEPFGWPVRHRMDAVSLSEPVDWDLARTPQEQNIFITHKDSRNAYLRKKAEDEILAMQYATGQTSSTPTYSSSKTDYTPDTSVSTLTKPYFTPTKLARTLPKVKYRLFKKKTKPKQTLPKPNIAPPPSFTVAPERREYLHWLRTPDAHRLRDHRLPVRVYSPSYCVIMNKDALLETKRMLLKEDYTGHTCTPRKRPLNMFNPLPPNYFKIEPYDDDFPEETSYL